MEVATNLRSMSKNANLAISQNVVVWFISDFHVV